tara:strand:- start:2789 stop:3661 length:873 start_codon:yes stop_codon:yes gene_type:complete
MKKNRKGIILAGGTGSRLYPATLGISKQLLPIYDKPMIFYPLSVLMSAQIKEIAIIIKEEDYKNFYDLLGDGSQFGISISFIYQPSPDGLAQAYILAEEFLNGHPSAMILGDNIFYGFGFREILQKASNQEMATIFGYRVSDPSSYGVADFDSEGNVVSIEEKPTKPASNYAVTGLYFLDHSAPTKAKTIKPSERGELEITSLLELYMLDNMLNLEKLGRGYAWLDTGTHENLLESANFIRSLQLRQGTQIGCIEEVALQNNWITKDQIKDQAEKFSKTLYGEYLQTFLD